MARRIRRLKEQARRAGIPTVYVNDNFGRWRSDFRTLVAHCLRTQGRAVTRLEYEAYTEMAEKVFREDLQRHRRSGR